MTDKNEKLHELMSKIAAKNPGMQITHKRIEPRRGDWDVEEIHTETGPALEPGE